MAARKTHLQSPHKRLYERLFDELILSNHVVRMGPCIDTTKYENAVEKGNMGEVMSLSYSFWEQKAKK